MAAGIQKSSYSAEQMLQFLLSSDRITLDEVAEQMQNAEYEKLLASHPYPITQGKDGRWRTYIKAEGCKRKQIAKSTRESVEDAVVDFYVSQTEEYQAAEKAKKATIEKLYPEWLQYKILHGAANTYIRRIESDWNTYYKGTEIVQKPVSELTKMDMDIWIHTLIQRLNHVQKQYYNISMIMRQILDYAVDSELIKENPMNKVKVDSRMVFTPARKKPSETQVFSREEVEKLYDAAWKDFNNGYNAVHKLAPLAVMIQFQLGVRIGELCALRYEDIKGSEIYVNRMYRYETNEVVGYTKGRSEGRYVVLTAEADRLIQTAREYQRANGLPDDGYIFSVNETPLSYYAVRKLYKRYCELIGTVDKTSHKARKTYISALIDENVNIDSVRAMVGHADERTTYNAYCFDRKTASERTRQIEKALSI